jgi:hypothetical protein
MTGNEAVKQAVLAVLGIGFLSLNTIGLERGLGLVHVPSIAGLPVVRRWHVVHRRGKQLLPIAQAFCDFVRDKGAEYANASTAPASRGSAAASTRAKPGRARTGASKQPARRARSSAERRR